MEYRPPLSLRPCGQQGLKLSEQGLGCKSLSPGTSPPVTLTQVVVSPLALLRAVVVVLGILMSLKSLSSAMASVQRRPLTGCCGHDLMELLRLVQASTRRRRRLPLRTRPARSYLRLCLWASASSAPQTSTGRLRMSVALVRPSRAHVAQISRDVRPAVVVPCRRKQTNR